MLLGRDVSDRLRRSTARSELLEHRFFAECAEASLTRRTTQEFLGQYWHPIHYFPEFLARTVAAVDDLAARTAVSKILYQELGEGRTQRAHETLYLETVAFAGFEAEIVSSTAANPATAKLVEGYRSCTSDGWSAVGYLFATEAADLTLVRALGQAISRTSGVAEPLPWVEVHLAQEPDHTAMADQAAELAPTASEAEMLIDAATEAWQRWIDFFSSLSALVARPQQAQALSG